MIKLDLDAIERKLQAIKEDVWDKEAQDGTRKEVIEMVPAIIAEVRRLRSKTKIFTLEHSKSIDPEHEQNTVVGVFTSREKAVECIRAQPSLAFYDPKHPYRWIVSEEILDVINGSQNVWEYDRDGNEI